MRVWVTQVSASVRTQEMIHLRLVHLIPHRKKKKALYHPELSFMIHVLMNLGKYVVISATYLEIHFKMMV